MHLMQSSVSTHLCHVDTSYAPRTRSDAPGTSSNGVLLHLMQSSAIMHPDPHDNSYDMRMMSSPAEAPCSISRPARNTAGAETPPFQAQQRRQAAITYTDNSDMRTVTQTDGGETQDDQEPEVHASAAPTRLQRSSDGHATPVPPGSNGHNRPAQIPPETPPYHLGRGHGSDDTAGSAGGISASTPPTAAGSSHDPRCAKP